MKIQSNSGAASSIALIRGINVGKAKRISMADLRMLVEGLGYREVRTLLNSGNVLFHPGPEKTADPGIRIEKAINRHLGISARVFVLTSGQLASLIGENPLEKSAADPSRLFAAILGNPSDRTKLRPLLERKWTPEALALGKRAAYLWCPDGAIKSPLRLAVDRILGEATTTRNWSTMMKLHFAAGGLQR